MGHALARSTQPGCQPSPFGDLKVGELVLALGKPQGNYTIADISDHKGVVVIEYGNSPAAQAGLATGDVIREVDPLPVQAVADVERGLSRRLSEVNEVLLRVERDGGERYVLLGAG